MTDDELRLLTRVLAATDAMFLPLRGCDWQHPRPAAVAIARAAFRDRGGVVIHSPGTPAERKRAERLIASCTEAGMLIARQRYRGQFLRLADDSEDFVRQLCGLPGLWLSFETVRRHVRDEWTPEIALNDGRGWGDGHGSELSFIESLMLPALVRGVAESRSTIRGHVCYRRVAPVPEFFADTEEVEPSPTLARFYVDELRAARSAISTAPTGVFELGELPLPVSMGAVV